MGTYTGTTITDNVALTVALQELETAVETAANSGIDNVVEDTTPQLGGDLDVLTRKLTTSTTDGDIVIESNGLGNVRIGQAGLGFNANADNSVIIGSQGNTSLNAKASIVAGGTNNDIFATTSWHGIFAGASNDVTSTGSGCVVLGGANNEILGANYNSILGGSHNEIAAGAGVLRCSILGGFNNNNGGSDAVILGGENNTIGLSMSGTIVGGNGASLDAPGLVAGTAFSDSQISGVEYNTLRFSTETATLSIGHHQVDLVFTGDTTISTAIVDGFTSTAGMTTGSTVTGSGIPGGTTILSVDSATQITLSANATATASGVSLTFGSTNTADNELRLHTSNAGNQSNYVGFKAPDASTASVTYTLPDAADNGKFLQTDASGVTSWQTPAGGSSYTATIQATNYTAAVDDEVWVDTATTAYTVTLPTSPTLGDRVRVNDKNGLAGTNNITVNGGLTDLINGNSDGPSSVGQHIINTNFTGVEFVYVDAGVGWRTLNLG
jgi:hypothetical protein